jgi:arylsulfatase A-like enzyme
LVMRLPGMPERSGERVAERVSLVDLAPTLLRHVGLNPAGQNADFADLLGASASGDQPVYFVHSNNAQIGTKVGDETFFYNASEYLQLGREYATPAEMPFLFDTARDPMFRSNLASERAARAKVLQEQAREWAASRVQIGGTLRAAVSAEDDAALDKLGYLSDQ